MTQEITGKTGVLLASAECRKGSHRQVRKTAPPSNI
jgi:hypothetical protein